MRNVQKSYGTDYFDATINRAAAWVIGIAWLSDLKQYEKILCSRLISPIIFLSWRQGKYCGFKLALPLQRTQKQDGQTSNT